MLTVKQSMSAARKVCKANGHHMTFFTIRYNCGLDATPRKYVAYCRDCGLWAIVQSKQEPTGRALLEACHPNARNAMLASHVFNRG